MQTPTLPATFKVGLTGGIGSGKSTVAEGFAALGVPIVDTDVIAHRLTAPGGTAIPAIRTAFGDAMIAPDGRMDRAAMRAAVFADASARQRLEAILHPMIRAQTERETAAASAASATGAPYVMLAVPLLVESGNWRARVDRVLVVDCPTDVQVERVMRRSALAREQVLAILAAQATREARLAAADDVIDNGGPPSALAAPIAALHARYSRMARERLGLS